MPKRRQTQGEQRSPRGERMRPKKEHASGEPKFSTSLGIPTPGPLENAIPSSIGAGPKYTMAGAAGRPNHKPVRSPGPAQYNVRANGISGSGGHSFGRAPREQAQGKKADPPVAFKLSSAYETNSSPKYSMARKYYQSEVAKLQGDTPGPASYGTPSTQKKNAGITIAGKRRAGKADKSPGPGHYNVPSTIGSGPKIQLKGKRAQSPGNDSPGPAAYDIKPSSDGPSYTMGQKYSARPADTSPGPAAYTPSAPPEEKRGFSMLGKALESIEHTPGPGAYTPRGSIGDDGPSYSFGRKPVEREQIEGLHTPGPGQYSPRSPRGRAGPSLGRRLPTKDTTVSPGPGAYDVARDDPQHGTSFGLHGNKGPNLEPRARESSTLKNMPASPGPAHYDPKSADSTGPAFSMARKYRTAGTHDSPGPAAYQPKQQASGPAYSMQGRGKPQGPFDPKAGPGPAPWGWREDEKDEEDKRKGPGFSFGTSAGHGTSVTSTRGPGPAAYVPPSTIGREVPAYSMQGRPSPRTRWAHTAAPMSLEEADRTMASTGRSMPSYTIGSKPNTAPNLESAITPGPGDYSVDRMREARGRTQSSHRTMGRPHKPRPPTERSPGPAAYSPRPEKKAGISMMGKRPQDSATDSPGPAAYHTEPPDDDKHRRGITIGSRSTWESPKTTQGPGPGSYDIPKLIGGSSAFSMAPKLISSSETASPGPAAYNISRDMGTDSPRYSMARKVGDIKRARREVQPGPGQYTPRRPTSGPSYSMGGKVSSTRASNTPGPGAYNLAKEVSRPGTKKSTFGGSARFSSSRNDVPGPGAYSPRSSRAEGITLKGKRQEKLDNGVPACTYNPADYDSVRNKGKGFTMGMRTETFALNPKLFGQE